jgi:transposase InsO family protein
MTKVKEFLTNQSTHQITQQLKKNKIYETIKSPSVRNNYQADVCYLPNPTINKGFKYILTCIDVYSRFAFAKPIKFKDGENVFHAFKIMMEEYGLPKNLNIDRGKEFIYKPFVEYCKNNNIELWYSDPQQDNKNAIIERWHRTLRNMVLKYTTATGKPYIGILQQLINNYNTTFHKTVQGIPMDIWKGEAKNNQSFKLIQHTLKVGDRVRHIIEKEGFLKNSSTANYSKKTFLITEVIKNAYFLEGLTKPFREHELIEAKGEDVSDKNDSKIEEAKVKERIKRRLKKEGLD